MNTEDIKREYRPKLVPLRWKRGSLYLLDQSRLPFEKVWLEVRDYQEASRAIKEMRVRGAPAIGVTASYAMALSVSQHLSLEENLKNLERAKTVLDSARPTAVNLQWATERALRVARESVQSGEAKHSGELRYLLERDADRVLEEEFDWEIRMGLGGVALLQDGDTVLTQCNAGGLATGTGLGTALAPVKIARFLGMDVKVIAPETRPWLQGSRLTAFELMEEGIPVKLVTDTAVGMVFYQRMVSSVMVGADRILSDGHVFNKIGTFKEAVLAREFGVPFYAVAPSSTFDMVSRVEEIRIEERDPEEVRTVRGIPVAPRDVEVYNPVFDVTPPKYVTAIITENGVAYPPFQKNIRNLVRR